MTILGAGLDTFWVPELPAPIGIFLPMRVAAPDDEWQEEGHELSINLVRPDRAEEVMLTIPLQMEQPPPLKTPGAEAGAVIPVVLTWEARDHGLYTLELYIDSRRQRSVAISVRADSELTAQAEESEEPE
jgi:Family of unknown function (DUF6941)